MWHTLFTGSDYDSWRRVKRLSILLRSLVTDNPDNLLEPLTSASSGSELGSKPYSEAYSIPGPAPSSPWSMGDEMRASDNSGPGGTVTKWHKLPSLPLMVLINVVSFSEFIVWERKKVFCIFLDLSPQVLRQNLALGSGICLTSECILAQCPSVFFNQAFYLFT